MNDTVKVDHRRKPSKGLNPTPAEMLLRVARFRDTQIDSAAFPDLKHSEHQRVVKYLISTDKLAGPAPIDAPHNFHLANMTMAPGVRPVVHAHPYNEVFIPLDAPFRFFWGDEAGKDEKNSVVLEAMDVLSVPAGVHRTFENIGDVDGHVLVIFDIAGDPHTEMIVPHDVYDEFYADGWEPGKPPKEM